MREIKFRGQRIDNGEWVYGFLYHLPLPSGVGCMILTTDNIHDDNSIEPEYHLAFTLWVDLFPVEPDTSGQFTGMRDKNGQKIYEGDIVRVCDEDDIDIGVVRYNEDFGKYIVVYSQVSGNWFDFEGAYGELLGCFYSEVIGNIYDNPELLKKE